MSTCIHLDCSSGASGDMLLGALIDAGAPEEVVRSALDPLDLDGWSLEVRAVTRAGIRATRAHVKTDEHHRLRTYRDVLELLESARLPGRVATRAKDVFAALAGAEARVHQVEPSDVHFHELSALDTVVDVVGCSAAFEHFGASQVTASAIATGTGSASTQHGTMPLPGPAVLELLQGRGATLFGRGDRELVTPTAAALLSVFVTSFGELPAMTVEATGYGAGEMDLERPNVLRALVGRTASNLEMTRKAILLEANVDDMNPELVPPLIDLLLEAGAQDAWVTPMVMKKGRPALTLSVLGSESSRDTLADIVFREATTLGVRFTTVSKTELERTTVEVDIEGHVIRVKLGLRDDSIVNAAPEYEDALRVARATGMPLKLVYARALGEATRPPSSSTS